MATVMGGVGYGLYFVAKVQSSGIVRLFYSANITPAIRLPYDRTTDCTSARTG